MEIGTDITWDIFTGLLLNTLSFWWMMIPAVILGLVVGAIPGFSAANTIIILLPLTFAMDVEAGLVFMVALYSAITIAVVWALKPVFAWEGVDFEPDNGE